MKLGILLLTNIILLPIIRTNVYSSIVKIKNLLETERQIIISLENYIKRKKNTNKGFAIIDKYLKRTKKEHEIAAKDVEHYVGNPINAYTLIKRQTIELKYVENIMGNTAAYKKNVNVEYPTMEDLKGAISGLLLTQMVYHLKTSQLANGTLIGKYSRSGKPFVEQVTSMSTSDCYELGRAKYVDNNYRRNIPWLIAALRKYKKSEYDVSNVTEYDILYQITFMHILMNDNVNTWRWTNKLRKKFRELNNSDIQKRYVIMLDEIREMAEKGNAELNEIVEQKGFSHVEVYPKDFSAACRSEIADINNNKRFLTCSYGYKLHPYLTLARIKKELLNLKPVVVRFHDVISNSEIQLLQQMVIPMLKRSDVAIVNSGVQLTGPSNTRISQGAWLPVHSSLKKKISRRVEHLTGLTMKSSERLYVNNYGIGGHYSQHHDYYEEMDTKNIYRGNRIATILFYLSDVEQGGATVFPYLGLAVFPIQGSAIFWENLLPTGEGDTSTLHASCPVMRGNKWIANKFIREACQKLTNPVSSLYKK